ncbi:hypothetical protein GOODEAATRI_005642 [Goodea atripinnis]|uniref:Uncharacterized protein n=1 Tax=Goodea atripinnis TaxID=208336 RepID=A0ABV0N8F4_9TELE
MLATHTSARHTLPHQAGWLAGPSTKAKPHPNERRTLAGQDPLAGARGPPADRQGTEAGDQDPRSTRKPTLNPTKVRDHTEPNQNPPKSRDHSTPRSTPASPPTQQKRKIFLQHNAATTTKGLALCKRRSP